VLGAGQHDPIGPGQVSRTSRPDQAHAGLGLERLKFIQVADARVGNDGDGAGHRSAGAGLIIKNTIFFGLNPSESLALPVRGNMEG
jgi:hypothetical protein